MLYAKTEHNLGGFLVGATKRERLRRQVRLIYYPDHFDGPPVEGQKPRPLQPAEGRIEQKDERGVWVEVCSFVEGKSTTVSMDSEILAGLFRGRRKG